MFFRFIDAEYNPLYLSKRTTKSTDSEEFLDAMTYANMIDSQEYKGFKRSTYSKLYSFLEMF
jgi:hypothetical protein